jgi:hypothetical protein
VIALAGGVSIVLAIQLLVFAALSDLVVTLHEELLDRVDRLEDDVDRLDTDHPREGEETDGGADDTSEASDRREPGRSER